MLGRPPRPVSGRKVPPGMRAYVLERDDFTCRRCGAKASQGATLVVDHIVAYSKGGQTAEPNLQSLCVPCNSGKSDRDPHPHDMRSGNVPAPAPADPKPKTVKDPTVGTWVLRPRGNAKQPCKTCGKYALEFWRGEIVERIGPGTYRVQWISWLDGSDTNSDIVRAGDMQDWYRFDDAERFTAACRWVLTQHDHKRSLSFANYGEAEPERLNFVGCR